MKCPYCGKLAKWCDNAEVYGKRYGKSYMCYWCEPCDAYVGCHNNTEKPLGTMANRELRKKRVQTHAVIDPLWKSGKLSRREVYRHLSDKLGYEVHVGEANLGQCEKIIEIAKSL